MTVVDVPVQSRITGGQRTVPTPLTSSVRGAREFTNATLADICARMGLKPYEITRDEAVLAEETPGIMWDTFSKTFGGHLRTEWPKGRKIPGYNKFLCAYVVAQPFVPTSPGKPGLVIRPPATVSAIEDDNQSFHVFSSAHHDDHLHYYGEYTRVNLPPIKLKWVDISYNCHDMWLKRMSVSNLPEYRALRARLILRSQIMREPSTIEVLEYLQGNPNAANAGLSYKDISAVFRAGEEEMECVGIQCVGYDTNLARIIQRNA